MKQYFSIFFLIIALLFFKCELIAQEIEADRPDQTESPVTVPVKVLQIETGFTYESFLEDNINVKNYSVAGTLIRYGLEDNLEFRLGTGYLIHKAEQTSYNFDDLLIGLKINFLKEDKAPIDLGLLTHLIVPFFPVFALNLAEPELIIAVSRSITDRLSVSVNTWWLLGQPME